MHVLLIEDDGTIGDSTHKGLRHDGFVIDWVCDDKITMHVVTASGTTSAESSSTLFDLMLPSLGLSRRGGLDVVREVRQRGVAVLILILTACDVMADRVTGLNVDADDYLTKPFGPQELTAHMHALLRRQGSRTDPLMRHGEVLFNPITREVLHARAPVRLSGRELAAPHALFAQSDKVWSIAQLQDSLYGQDEEVDSNTVEVYTHVLCKKLGNHFVQNIRGVGCVIPCEVSTSPAESADSNAYQ